MNATNEISTPVVIEHRDLVVLCHAAEARAALLRQKAGKVRSEFGEVPSTAGEIQRLTEIADGIDLAVYRARQLLIQRGPDA
jgi:hypothetical protein